MFRAPRGVAVDATGTIYVTDSGNDVVREIDTLGNVSTIATGFLNPRGIAVDAAGIYVADYNHHVIKVIDPVSNAVTTLAGSGSLGADDATGTLATFWNPWGVGVDPGGNVYVADSGNATIRKLTAGGAVTTLVGTAGSIGATDAAGPAASFNWPAGVALDPVTSNLFVADRLNSTIRKVTVSWTYTIMASAGPHGSIVPGPIAVNNGDTVTFTVTPDPGYYIFDLTVDGSSVGRLASYTFANVSANHTITASFLPIAVVSRVTGADRYAVAAGSASIAYPSFTGVADVVIASGLDAAAADPLSASSLTGAYKAPLLLVSGATVPPSTNSTLRAIIAANAGTPGYLLKVHVVGGTSSVPNATLTTLRAIPGVNPSIDRISGINRYDLARSIALRVKSVVGTPTVVYFACASNVAYYYDALAAAPAAAHNTYPILLVASTSVPSWTGTAISALGVPNSGRYVIGTPAAVATSVVTAVGASRIDDPANLNRFGTSVAFANTALSKGWATNATIGVANALPDATAGSAAIGAQGGVMLYTNVSPLAALTDTYLITHKIEVLNCYIFGGTASVATSTETQIRTDLTP
jgi:hypothetical protein